MIPGIVLKQVREGYGLAPGHIRVLSTRFGKICIAHTGRDGKRTQIRLVRVTPDAARSLEAEMAWLTHLAMRHGCAVPVPRQWDEGGPVSPILHARGTEEWRAVACSWVPGRHLDRGLRARDARRAGVLLGALHRANRDAPPGVAAARPDWGISRLFELAITLRDLIAGRIASPSGLPEEFADALRASHARLERAWDALPTGASHVGIIHTDAHWQNLRWTRTRVGIVDFEDCANGRFMLDLACFWAKLESRRNATALVDATLEGYDQVRSLSEDAMRDLRIMRAFRRFDYAGWILSWPRLNMRPWGPEFLAGTPAYMDRMLSE